MTPRSNTTWEMPRPERQWLMASPAWPAPMTATSVVYMGGSVISQAARLFRAGPRGRQGRLLDRADLDRHRHAICQDVEDSRTVTGLVQQLPELFRWGIAFYLEANRDVAVAVADLVRDAEDAAKVDVALDEGSHPVELDAAGGGNVADPGGQASRESMKQPLDRRW